MCTMLLRLVLGIQSQELSRSRGARGTSLVLVHVAGRSVREQRSSPAGRRAGDGMDAGRRATQEQLLNAPSKKELPQRKRHPIRRLPGIGKLLLHCLDSASRGLAMRGKSVSRGWACRQGIGQPLLRCLNSGIHAVACAGEKEPPSMSTPAARPVVTASQGPRIGQRAVLARTRYASASRWRE